MSLVDGVDLLQSRKSSPFIFIFHTLTSDSLDSSEYATSSHFKTAGTKGGGLQAVMLGTPVRRVFAIYIDKVRPAVAPRGEDPAKARLFLTAKGEPDANLGLHVSRFARRLGLKLTATSIRAIVDTCVVAEHRRGNISDEQLSATLKVSGHSMDTSQQYYQRYKLLLILLLL